MIRRRPSRVRRRHRKRVSCVRCVCLARRLRRVVRPAMRGSKSRPRSCASCCRQKTRRLKRLLRVSLQSRPGASFRRCLRRLRCFRRLIRCRFPRRPSYGRRLAFRRLLNRRRPRRFPGRSGRRFGPSRRCRISRSFLRRPLLRPLRRLKFARRCRTLRPWLQRLPRQTGMSHFRKSGRFGRAFARGLKMRSPR